MVRTGLQWFLTSTGPAASSHLETGAFVRSRPDVTFPDIQLHFLPSVIIDHGQKMGDFHAFQASLCYSGHSIYTVKPYLHCTLAAAHCIVIGPVCGRVGVFVGVTTITRNCMHRSSPNWVCR